jgi:hypothetical protein
MFLFAVAPRVRNLPRRAVSDDPGTFAVLAQGTITIFFGCGYWGGGDFEVNNLGGLWAFVLSG